MRWLLGFLSASALVLLILLYSGGSRGFPALGAEVNGHPRIAVASQGDADSLCRQAHTSWPEEWQDEPNAVMLDPPEANHVTICLRPGGPRSVRLTE